MPSYHGRIDDLADGILTGFVVDRDAPQFPVSLRVVVNGGDAATVSADTERLTPSHGPASDEGRANGFRIDLSEALGQSDGDIHVTVRTADGCYEVPGSPIVLSVAADAFVDHTRGGVIVGWAHGPWFARCHVELWSGDAFLLSWPADQSRSDLEQSGVGNGDCAFFIPIRSFFGADLPPAMRIRADGGRIDLAVPPDLSASHPPGRSLDLATASAFPDLEALHRELEAATRACAHKTRAGADESEISFEALQGLLDQIERLADERRSLRAAATVEAAHAGGPATAAEVGTSLPELEIELAEMVRRYGEDAAFRERLEHCLARASDPERLAEIATALRAADFIRVAHVALARSIEVARPVKRSALRRLRHLAAWRALVEEPASMLRSDAARPVRRAQAGPRRRRTLYCIWRSLPYETAGYDTRSHYLLRGFAKAGHDVIACTRPGFPWDGKRAAGLTSFEQIDGVHYVRLGSKGMSNASVPLDAFLEAHASRIAHLALASGADIVHSATNWLVGLPALMAARRLGLPFVYEMRGLMEVTRSSTVPGYAATDHFELFRRMEAEVARAADVVFTITAGVRDEMARRGCDTRSFELAPNGVDCERFQPLRRDSKLAYHLGIGSETVFGFIGSFLHYEGLSDLVEAAAMLKARGRRFKLLLVGDGPHAREVREAVRDRGVADMTILTGRMPFEAVPRLYSLIDIAVFPRRGIEVTEIVSPLKPFEAMAMGKPVIASNVRALADIVRHGETGWLFEKNNVVSLCDALDAALSDPRAADIRGAAARAFVASGHDWSAIAARIGAGWDGLRRGLAHA